MDTSQAHVCDTVLAPDQDLYGHVAIKTCDTVLAPDQDLYGHVAIKMVPAANLSLLAGAVQHRYANQLREGGRKFEHLTSLR